MTDQSLHVYDALRSEIYKINKDEIATDILIAQLMTKGQYANTSDLDLHGYSEWTKCSRCPIAKNANSRVPFFGSFSPKLIIVGEAPGPEEDELGGIFIGKTGRFLRESLYRVGIDVFKDVLFFNTISCIPKDTKNSPFRAPNTKEIDNCLKNHQYYQDVLSFSTKTFHLYLGKTSLNVYLQSLNSEDEKIDLKRPFSDYIGFLPTSPEDEMEPIHYCTYHPSYIVRNQNSENYKELYTSWLKDLNVAKKYIVDKTLIDWRNK